MFEMVKLQTTGYAISGWFTDALTIAAELSSPKVYSDLWDMQLYLIEGMDHKNVLSLDRRFYQKKINKLAEVTGQKTVLLPYACPAKK
ncbi:hypothetical protein L2D08_16940 [Domibacillus sp. PGB-M46]|uniref:hypothetical protein n=1 Tax=Domibacillus sp. PGB-M46 TaxID=2910255 RepID=UPI001F571A40|nr:hypothetical protein [Domibacillus sp. PGB-M46]MCI2256041.1 hypothetical protein [Domibacillus sp. PGB-M46]